MNVAPDPIQLLTREHEMILDRLRMVEAAIPRATRGRTPPEPTRRVLRELLQFFTDRVEVHFNREAVLLTTLNRSLGNETTSPARFGTLLREHRDLRAEAAKIARSLGRKSSGSAPTSGPDPLGLRTFVRRYRAHLSYEERVLFVLADMRLTASQRQRISRRMLQV